MRLQVSVLAVALILSAGTVASGSPSSEMTDATPTQASGPLSLGDAFDALQRHHPLFAKAALEVAQARGVEALKRLDHIWYLDARQDTLTSGGDPANTFSPQQVFGATSSFGLRRDFKESGGRLEFGLDASYLYLDHNDDAGRVSLGIPNQPDMLIPLTKDGLQGALSLRYTHPLWKNPGVLEELALQDARLKADEVELRVAESQEALAHAVASRYVQWWFLTEQREIVGKRVQLATENLRLVQKRQRARLAEKVDVLRAQQAVQLANGGLSEVRVKIDATVSELEVILGLSLEGRQPASVYSYREEGLQSRASQDNWMDPLGRIRALESLKRRMGLQIDAQRELAKPELALVLSAGVKREDFRYTDDTSEGEFNPDAFAGLVLSYPLGEDPSNAMIENASIAERVVDEELREQKVMLRSLRARIDAESAALRELLKVKERQLQIASQRYREERKMFRLGRTLLNFVIESQDQVQEAKMERLDVRARLALLRIERLALFDLLGR